MKEKERTSFLSRSRSSGRFVDRLEELWYKVVGHDGAVGIVCLYNVCSAKVELQTSRWWLQVADRGYKFTAHLAHPLGLLLSAFLSVGERIFSLSLRSASSTISFFRSILLLLAQPGSPLIRSWLSFSSTLTEHTERNPHFSSLRIRGTFQI